MQLKSNKVQINDEAFEIHELKIKDMIELMPMFADENQASAATLELMQKCVYKDGKLLGPQVGELGLSFFSPLSEEVLKVNGLGDSGK